MLKTRAEETPAEKQPLSSWGLLLVALGITLYEIVYHFTGRTPRIPTAGYPFLALVAFLLALTSTRRYRETGERGRIVQAMIFGAGSLWFLLAFLYRLA